jgi:hypothetical protein
MRGHTRWTDHELAILHDCARSTATLRQAATRIGRSVQAVRRRSQLDGLKFKHRELGGRSTGKVSSTWSHREDRELSLMVGEATVATMAREFGRTRGAILARLYKLGLGARSQGTYSMQAIADMLGVSAPTVQAYRDRLGHRWGRRVGGSITPGATAEHVSAIAAYMLASPRSQVNAPASTLRRIAEGDLPA